MLPSVMLALTALVTLELSCAERCERALDERGRSICIEAPIEEIETTETSNEVLEAGTSEPECRSNADCADPGIQRHCVDDRCVVTCQLHTHCTGVGTCSGSAVDVEGRAVSYCELDTFPRAPGQFDWACPNGNRDCDVASEFRCLARGDGDLEGYCSRLGCEQDDDCPLGSYCNRDGTSNQPCEAACGLPGDSSEGCIPAEDIGEGRPFGCGEDGLELRSCQRRSYCSECQTDADCRGLPNQLCARDPSGIKICTELCDPEASGCPWGTASSCSLTDEDVGRPTCSHRYGACSGEGRSCDPCIQDRDCPGGFCSGSLYTGERFCYDRADTCSCPRGAEFCFGGGCPATPGGLPMNCVPASAGAAPSACYGASVIPGDETSQLGCWSR